jgi:RNase P/RNase MRP subunit p29
MIKLCRLAIVFGISARVVATSATQLCLADEPGENSIVANDSVLELVHQRQTTLNSGLTEGPAVAPDGSILLYRHAIRSGRWDDFEV